MHVFETNIQVCIKKKSLHAIASPCITCRLRGGRLVQGFQLVCVFFLQTVQLFVRNLFREVIFAFKAAVGTSALINAIVDTSVADTFTAAVLEPPVRRGPHGLTGHFALLLSHALPKVGHGAVDCHHAVHCFLNCNNLVVDDITAEKNENFIIAMKIRDIFFTFE